MFLNWICSVLNKVRFALISWLIVTQINDFYYLNYLRERCQCTIKCWHFNMCYIFLLIMIPSYHQNALWYLPTKLCPVHLTIISTITSIRRIEIWPITAVIPPGAFPFRWTVAAWRIVVISIFGREWLSVRFYSTTNIIHAVSFDDKIVQIKLINTHIHTKMYSCA